MDAGGVNPGAQISRQFLAARSIVESCQEHTRVTNSTAHQLLPPSGWRPTGMIGFDIA
jgi:hypothetical protein